MLYIVLSIIFLGLIVFAMEIAPALNNKFKAMLIVALTIIGLVFALCSFISADHHNTKKNLNNGICPYCHCEYELIEKTKDHDGGMDTYWYCNSCKRIIVNHSYF